jgi:hypothetical protein
MKRTLANISVMVNSKNIRKETRNGREVIVVPSKTLPKDIVMNGILYPGDEVAASYKTLEKTPAPYGHPKVNGSYVDAKDPEALNVSWIGAWNEKAEYDGERVSIDKVIDVEVAKQTVNGRSVLDAIDKGEPIHTSTGVYFDPVELPQPVTNSRGQKYTMIAKNMYFNHDCFLIGEMGAATPDQGVGVFVNSNQEECQVLNELITNSMLESYESSVEWAVKNLVDSVESLEKAKQSKGLVEKILSALGIGKDKKPGESLQANGNSEEIPMPISEEEFKALADSVKALTANAENIASAVEKAVSDAVAPLTQKVDALTANAAEAEKVERTELTAKVVANNLLTEETAKTLSVNALRELAGKVNGDAAPITQGVFMPNNSGYKSLSDELPGEAA